MWSVGCILAELLRRKPFLPGTESTYSNLNSLSYHLIAKNQLELIIEIFGNLSEEEINSIPKEKFRKFLKSMPEKTAKSLPNLFPNANPLGNYLLLFQM